MSDDESVPFDMKGNEQMDATLRSVDLLRGSSDKKRTDHFQELRNQVQSTRQIIEATEEEEADDDEHEDIILDENGENIRNEKQHARLFREIALRVKNLVSKEKSSKIRVEVRLQNVFYHVPVPIDAEEKETVMNQNPLYRLYQILMRTLDYFKTRSIRDLHKIFAPYTKKPILSNVNLIFKPGRSYLIMGAPGCGKTTLLQVIAGLAYEKRDITGAPLADHAHISGDITFNGLSPTETPDMILQNVVSYVEQLDDHEPYLTVKETFDFAQQCRVGIKSKTVPSERKNNESESDTLLKKKVTSENLTIEGLGLTHVADTFVGNSDVRGVSGGQRRRVTVGEMMQGENPVACADEISTGLDSASTYDMIRSIVHFAKAEYTTRIISLLQPGPETFSLFDEVVILSEGYVIFAGSIDEVVKYFENLGYIKPVAMDVADFLQSVATPDGAEMMDLEIRQDGHLTPEGFAATWQSSSLGKRISNVLKDDIPTRWTIGDVSNGDEENPNVCITPLPDAMKKTYQNSMKDSLKLVFMRFFTVWKRNKALIIGRALENIAMSLTVGMVLYKSGYVEFSCDPTDPTIVLNRNEKANDFVDQNINGIFAGLFLTCFKLVQGLSTDISTQVASRGIFYKQVNANFFQVISFIIGQLISTFPQRLIETLAFSIPVYFLIGFHLDVRSFLLNVLMVLMLAICLNMVYMILVMSLATPQKIQSVGIFLLLILTTWGGFIVSPNNMAWSKFVYFINPIAWAYQGLLSIEYTSNKYDETKTCVNSAYILESRGFAGGREYIGWSFCYIIGLAIIATGLLVVASKYFRFQVIKNKSTPLSDSSTEESNAEYDIPFTKINLTFQNICYDVKSSSGDETLRLLDNVSGTMMSGRMCALMGSSGAGKTTLMDVISLRKISGEIAGTVELNGFPQEKKSFLRVSGYVEQFDIQTAQLTVYETVLFSAQLRLDSKNESTADEASKQQFVHGVLEMLELTSLKDRQIGDLQLNKGLSFEERKRLAIAVELAGSPSVLFLDEPTSGLDARGAAVVMRAMKKIANTGRTVCATIHQPSSAVFEMFDDLLLLKKGGKLVFFGDLGENSIHLTNYFEAHGSEPIKYGENPASWMLLASEIKEPTEWAELYRSSDQYKALVEQIESEHDSLDSGKKILFEDEFATSRMYRVRKMLSRVSKIYRRSPAYNLNRMLFAVIMGLIFGLGFEIAASNEQYRLTTTDADSLFGLIFFANLVMGIFSIISVIPEVKKIRDVFYKQRASGMLGHNSVTFAIIVGEMPYIFLLSVLFSFTLFFCLRISQFLRIRKALLFWAFFDLSAATYTYFGQLFISLVKDIPTANALAGALIGINLFGSGFIVKPKFGGKMLLPMFYISPGHYAYEGMLMNLVEGVTLEIDVKPDQGFYQHLKCEGEGDCIGTLHDYAAFVFDEGFDFGNTYQNISVLIGYLVFAIIVTHWALGHFNHVNT